MTFLALYRLALRLGPRAFRERHAGEQLELIQRMVQEEAPRPLLAAAAWRLARLARAAWTSLAAHLDRWPGQRSPQPLLTGAGGDLRLALRSLRRSPWYAGSTVVVLGAGIALSALVFAIVDGVLFKPLPYPDSGNLFVIDAQVSSKPSTALAPVSTIEIRLWAAAAPDLMMTTVSATGTPFNRQNGVTQVMRYVDEHFFDVIGIQPRLGTFLPEDFEWRNEAVLIQGRNPLEMYWPVIISHAAWRQDFGMDPSVVGRRITRSEREGSKFGIIIRGVLPPDFVFPLDSGGRQPDVLAPEGLSRAQREASTRRYLHVLARVVAGAPTGAVETRLREVTQRESRQPSTDDIPHGGVAQEPFDALQFVPIGAHLGASARPALQLIAAGAALLLLVICLNVTGLAAARGVERATDFATRRALGASAWRIARLITVEVLVLIAGGVTLGVWLANPMLHTTLSLLPQSLVLLKTPAIDFRVLSAVAIAAVACAGLIAVLPALRASRLHRAVLGGHSGRRSVIAKKGGLILIGAQAALGFVLLTAGGLTVTSLALAWANDAGFAADRTVLLEAYLSTYRDDQDSLAKLTNARARLTQVPGVTGIAATNIHMFSSMFPSVWAPTGSEAGTGTTDHRVEQTFFDVMGLRAIEGRLPDSGEWAPNSPFAVVSESTARLWWPGEAAVGRRIYSTRQRTSPERTVVAVVRDTRYESLDREPLGAVYLPIDFANQTGAVFVVRSAGSPDDVIAGLLTVSRDAGLRIERAVPLDEALFIATVHRALPAWLFGSLGLVGLAVLAVGTFGLLAMSAAQRTREMVIRVALGASPGNVIALLARDQLTSVIAGMAVGAVVSYWTMALLQSQLYRVSPFSPAVWLASAGALVGVAAIATLIPSISRARVDPALALRVE